METIWQDVRYAFRLMFKSPIFSLIAILSLGLGIGVNTAIFSLTNALMLRPLPLIKNTEGLVWVFSSIHNGSKPISSSYLNFVDFRDQNNVFSGLAAFTGVPLSLKTDAQAEILDGEIVSANYFSVLGVEAAQGRTFLPEEDLNPGAHPVIVISNGLWLRRFGGDPGIIGKSVILNGTTFTIVGISPKGFVGTEIGSSPDIWVPMSMHEQLVLPAERSLEKGGPRLFDMRQEGWLNLLGRLKPGTRLEQAQTDLQIIASQLEQTHQDTNKGVSAKLYPLTGGLDPREQQEFLPASGILMGVVALVLLMVCNNLASLLLARSATRQKEIAIRLSLGAGRGRLVRQLLTESLVLAMVGGTIGLLLAFWVSNSVIAYASLPISVGLDARVLVFALVLSILAALAFGLAPSIQGSKTNLVSALKSNNPLTQKGYRRSRLRNLLIIGQVTLSLTMLISAGLFIKSLNKMDTVDTGFGARTGLIVPLDLGLQNYSETKGKEFYRQLVERVGTVPGVQSVGLTEYIALDPTSSGQAIVNVEGQFTLAEDADAFRVGTDTVDIGYFQTMQIPLLKGRDFNIKDNADAPKVAIVNENLAHQFWPDVDPIGKRFSLSANKGPYLEIIGVVKNGSYRILGERPQPYMYVPLAQNYVPNMNLVVSATNNMDSLSNAVRSQIQSIDANLPLTNITSLNQLVNKSLSPVRTAALLLGAFGLLALVLAAAGIYGVTAYSVSQRTQEIGIRMALGARPIDVLKLVIRDTMITVAIGVGLGIAFGFGISQVIKNFVFGILSVDFLAFAVIPALLLLVALIACYLPARKAMKVSPLIALKFD